MEINRAFDMSVKRKTQTFLCEKEVEKGHPVGLRGNKAVPIMEKNEGFLGFAEANLDDGRLLVTIRGACSLKIEDIYKAKIGDLVFCKGANEFSLSEGSLVGILKHIQPDFPGFGMVCFKRFDDKEQFDLRK